MYTRLIRRSASLPAAAGSGLLLAGLTLIWSLAIGGCPPLPSAGGTGQAGQPAPAVPGPAGPAGEPGPAGPEGPPGPQGERGLHGINGQDGADGKDGADGNDGQDGQDGQDGADGKDGKDGQDGQDLTRPPGAPAIDSLTDVSGGLLVVGDLLDIAGSNLDAVDVAYVGQVSAPILAQTEQSMRIQVPAGVSGGANLLRLVAFSGDTGFVESIAALKVHRLAVFLGEAQDRIVIADTLDHSVIHAFDQAVGSTTRPPYHLAFANQGSLAIVPTGQDKLVWIDLTADPPASGALTLAGAVELLGAAVSPDDTLVVVNDLQGDALYPVTIAQALPPYADPLSAAGQAVPTGANTGPHAPAFASATTVVVPLFESDALAIFERVGDTLADTGNRADDGAIDKPTQVRLVPTRSMLVACKWGNATDSELRSYFVGSTSISEQFVGQALLGDALAFDLATSGNFAYTIPFNSDRITAVMVGSPNMEVIGESGDPASHAILNAIAVQPVDGQFLYVGLSGPADSPPYVDIFDITNGGTLDLRTGRDDDLYHSTELNRCFGIGVQP